MAPELYVQRDQPPGVPPLHLTGERTLPDVPEENYWFRRHLVVYEWIARRVQGRRVVDLACGEGYGSAVLGRTAASVVGVDANPEAHEHARLKYTGERRVVRARHDRDVDGRRRLRRVPADDRARAGPRRGDARACATRRPGRRRLRLHAERADPRAAGRGRVRTTRGTCASTGRRSSARCARGTSREVELLGLFHARKLRLHQLAIERLRLGRACTRGSVSRARSTTASARPSPRATSRCGRRRLERALDLLAVLRP